MNKPGFKPRLPPDSTPTPVCVDNELVRVNVFHLAPDLIDVDQDRGSGQAKIHRWYQALSASQKFRVVAMFGLERERVLEGGGGYVFEGGRLHGARVKAIETQLRATGTRRCCESMRRPPAQVKKSKRCLAI